MRFLLTQRHPKRPRRLSFSVRPGGRVRMQFVLTKLAPEVPARRTARPTRRQPRTRPRGYRSDPLLRGPATPVAAQREWPKTLLYTHIGMGYSQRHTINECSFLGNLMSCLVCGLNGGRAGGHGVRVPTPNIKRSAIGCLAGDTLGNLPLEAKPGGLLPHRALAMDLLSSAQRNSVWQNSRILHDGIEFVEIRAKLQNSD